MSAVAAPKENVTHTQVSAIAMKDTSLTTGRARTNVLMMMNVVMARYAIQQRNARTQREATHARAQITWWGMDIHTAVSNFPFVLRLGDIAIHLNCIYLNNISVYHLVGNVLFQHFASGLSISSEDSELFTLLHIK